MSHPAPLVRFSVEDELIQAIFREEKAKLPAGVSIDIGPALPVSYGVSRIQLMVQDPYWIFAYWEVTEALKKSVLSMIPIEDRDSFQLVIRLYELKENNSRWLDTGTVSNCWFHVSPACEYQARLELYSQDYGHIPLVSSNSVLTPEITLVPVGTRDSEVPAFLPWLGTLMEMTGIPWRSTGPDTVIGSQDDFRVLPSKTEPSSASTIGLGAPEEKQLEESNNDRIEPSGGESMCRPSSFCVPTREEEEE